MVQNGFDLVYGGGRVGLMGIVADAILADGGHVTGVIPGGLFGKEVAHQGIQELEVVKTMHERKARMEVLSDAFVALPGGWGTLDELFEILTWGQLGIHKKPVAILNINGFYEPLLQQIDVMVKTGFLSSEHRDQVIVGDTVEGIIHQIQERLSV